MPIIVQEQYRCDTHLVLGCVKCIQSGISLRMQDVQRECAAVVKRYGKNWQSSYQTIAKMTFTATSVPVARQPNFLSRLWKRFVFRGRVERTP